MKATVTSAYETRRVRNAARRISPFTAVAIACAGSALIVGPVAVGTASAFASTESVCAAPTATVSQDAVTPGETVTVTGCGFSSTASSITATFNGPEEGALVTSAIRESYNSVSFTTPELTEPGTYDIVLTSDTGDEAATATVTLGQEAGGAGSETTSPHTTAPEATAPEPSASESSASETSPTSPSSSAPTTNTPSTSPSPATTTAAPTSSAPPTRSAAPSTDAAASRSASATHAEAPRTTAAAPSAMTEGASTNDAPSPHSDRSPAAQSGHAPAAALPELDEAAAPQRAPHTTLEAAPPPGAAHRQNSTLIPTGVVNGDQRAFGAAGSGYEQLTGSRGGLVPSTAAPSPLPDASGPQSSPDNSPSASSPARSEGAGDESRAPHGTNEAQGSSVRDSTWSVIGANAGSVFGVLALIAAAGAGVFIVNRRRKHTND